jgi:hypothetical protein
METNLAIREIVDALLDITRALRDPKISNHNAFVFKIKNNLTALREKLIDEKRKET